MKPLKKMNKTQLKQLVNMYEKDINDLTDELEKMSLQTDRVEYIYAHGEDDKSIQYIKKRLKCVRGIKRLPYIKEYERLTKT